MEENSWLRSSASIVYLVTTVGSSRNSPMYDHYRYSTWSAVHGDRNLASETNDPTPTRTPTK